MATASGSDMSDEETTFIGNEAEKNQRLAARVVNLQNHSAQLLSSLATLKAPVLLYSKPCRGEIFELGEDYRSSALGERHGIDPHLGYYTLSQKQISISYHADPAFPALKMIGNWRIGNFYRAEMGERGIFLQLVNVFADERLVQDTSPTRLQFLISQMVRDDVVLTRRYQQGEHFRLNTNRSELEEAMLGVDLEIRHTLLEMLESIGYLSKVKVDDTLPSNANTVYAMMSLDAFRFGGHSDAVKAFGTPAQSKNSIKLYLLQSPLCCMQVKSKFAFGSLTMFCDVCKKRKPYLETTVNQPCRNYLKKTDPRVYKIRRNPKWCCKDCLVGGEFFFFFWSCLLFFNFFVLYPPKDLPDTK